MTHSFIKRSDGDYDVGIWLLSHHRPGTHQFIEMARVGTLRGAIRLTNTLNGGNGNIDSVMERTAPKDIEGPTNGTDLDGTKAGLALVRKPRG